jgi:hypothetical protein
MATPLWERNGTQCYAHAEQRMRWNAMEPPYRNKHAHWNAMLCPHIIVGTSSRHTSSRADYGVRTATATIKVRFLENSLLNTIDACINNEGVPNGSVHAGHVFDVTSRVPTSTKLPHKHSLSKMKSMNT